MGQRDIFAKAKAFSDFLGFHVRFLFCVAVALVALAVPLTSILSPEDKVGLWALENPIGVLLFFVMSGYALTMAWLTVKAGLSYLNNRYYNRNRTIKVLLLKVGYVLIQTTILLWLFVYGGYQTLELTGIDWQVFVCEANAYLSKTNYPMTPPRPSYCLSK